MKYFQMNHFLNKIRVVMTLRKFVFFGSFYDGEECQIHLWQLRLVHF